MAASSMSALVSSETAWNTLFSLLNYISTTFCSRLWLVVKTNFAVGLCNAQHGHIGTMIGGRDEKISEFYFSLKSSLVKPRTRSELPFESYDVSTSLTKKIFRRRRIFFLLFLAVSQTLKLICRVQTKRQENVMMQFCSPFYSLQFSQKMKCTWIKISLSNDLARKAFFRPLSHSAAFHVIFRQQHMKTIRFELISSTTYNKQVSNLNHV